MREIIYLYAGVADDLSRLDSSIDYLSNQDKEENIAEIVNKFRKGETLYNEFKDTIPKGNRVVQSRFRIYRVSTSTIFGLLNLYFELLPWVHHEASSHRPEAIEIVTNIRSQYPSWFLATKDIPVIGWSEFIQMELMISKMVEKSMALIVESRKQMQTWTPATPGAS